MKKISLFLIALLFSLSSYAQLPLESFESWTPGQGPANWKILQNDIGTNTQWVQTTLNFDPTPPHTGQYAAYMQPQNVSTGIPEDYLVTPLFNAPVNGRVEFYSRLIQVGDQGSIYKVKLLPAGADADDITNYIELQSWTELEINPVQTDYTKVTVEIPAEYEGTNVRIAFVILSDNGDRWLIDDVRVISLCVAPENLSATNITTTTADLSWDNPSGATEWEIEIKEEGTPATGTGIIYNEALPYTATNLNPGTQYNFLVRALCDDGGESEWVGAYNFTTFKPGDNCQTPKIITSLPYSSTDNTANYFDVYQGNNGGCGTPSFSSYLDGNDITYAFTPTQNGIVSINVTGITEAYAGIFIYTSCNDIGTNCFAGTVNEYETPAPDLNIPSMNVTAGTTYYIVISTWFAQTTGFTLNIQQEFCDKPSDLTATNPTNDGITLGWESSSSSSWQYIIQPVGSGLPMGSGLTATTNPITVTSLNPSTQYEFYVRANCGDGTFSSWAGPLVFNTLCASFTVPYTEGFNSNSTSQFCWNIADNNNDGVVWDMDFTYDSYEGDQSAKFDVGSTSENDDMLISPAILLTGNERLRFFYKTQQYGAIAFKVMASTTGNAPEDFTIELSPLTSYGVDNFTEKIINLTNLPAGPVYFAWYVPAGFNGGYELMIDNIIVETMPDCAEPSDIVVNNISNNSAHIEWTAGNNESQWEIIVGQADVVGTPGASTTGTTWNSTMYNATNLNSNTLQAVYIRSVCSSASKSIWQGPYYFTTKCDAFDTPFTEGFNSDSATEQCWKVVNNNGDWAEWNMSDNVAFEGDEAASIYVGNPANDEWLISPAINLTGNERLKFHYKISDANNGETGFRLLLSTTNSDLSSFTEVLLPETAYTNEEYLVKVISLESYTGPVYLAWHVSSTYEFGSDLYIDNVIVEPIPSCPEPLYVEVSNITQTSAEVTWQAGGTETEWELLINIQGEEVPATGISVTSLPFTITELPDGTPIDSGTPYEITLKAVCSATESSLTSDKVVFATLISNDNCDTAKTIPVNVGPVCDVYASGTLNGATESSQQNPCGDWTSADDDVWFEFTATSSLHTLSLIDITQGAPYLMYIIYEDDCDNLTQIGDCMTAYSEYGIEASTTLLENLTVGTTYKIRIFSAEATTNQTTTFKVCVKVPVTPIAVNTDQYTVEQLVTDVLFNGDCAQVSNITWSTGTNYPDPDNIFGDNPNGIGYFNQNGSGFPFAEGIVMTTGDVLKVPGPNYRGMEQGSAVWLGDTDVYNVMEGMLGAPPFQDNTNASVIEFDFVPSQPTFSFDFIFASEEYGDLIQCYSYDTFAVLLTDSNGNTQNIAVIPGTQTPISVFSISGAGYPNFCPGYNLDYFDKYNVFGNNDLSSTAFDGQTVVMTATADVQVNQPYHLKIAIAETDNNLDSGVFIKAGINGSGEGSVDLGEDLLVSTNNAICEGQTATLHTDLDPSVFEIEWSLNDNVIDGETGQDLVVSQPGNYKVSANIIGYNCLREDSIVVEFYPSVADATGNPTDLTVCDADGFAEFDLSQNTVLILEGLNPADYTISYHLTSDEAANNTGAINNPYTNVTQFTQTLYVRIQDNSNLCYAIKSFTINAEDLTPQFTITEDFSICEGNSAAIVVTPINFNIEDVTFTWTLNGDALADTTPAIEADTEGVYEVTVGNTGCTSTAAVNVTVIPAPIADAPADIEACDSYMLPALSPGNNYYTQTGGTGTMLIEGDVITSTQEIFVYAQTTTTPACNDEKSFIVTITPTPAFSLGGPYTACSADNVTIEIIDANFDMNDAEYAWALNGVDIEGGKSITGSGFGIYTLTVTVNNCTHTESVEIIQDPNAIALLFEEGCDDNVYMLSVIDDNGSFNIDSASYAWTGPNGFTSDKREFAVPAIGEYFVTVSTPEGCVGEDSFIVADTSCDIQRGISPNGDGKNDEFDLTTLNVKKLSIFNRYGQEVYTKSNYKKEWNGQTNKGDELPTGTYFYMIERISGETNTGWIYINRQE